MTSDLSETKSTSLMRMRLSYLVSVSKKWPRSPLGSKILRKSMPSWTSQSLDLDWQSLRVVEDRKAFDQMKESSQTLEAWCGSWWSSSWWRGAGALSLLLSLWTRGGFMKSGSSYPLGRARGRIFRQFLLEVVLVSLTSSDPSLSHRADGQPSFLKNSLSDRPVNSRP